MRDLPRSTHDVTSGSRKKAVKFTGSPSRANFIVKEKRLLRERIQTTRVTRNDAMKPAKRERRKDDDKMESPETTLRFSQFTGSPEPLIIVQFPRVITQPMR